jgi:hypothetical protein
MKIKREDLKELYMLMCLSQVNSSPSPQGRVAGLLLKEESCCVSYYGVFMGIARVSRFSSSPI